MSLPGLMWNVNRIGAPAAWKTSTGSPAVTVGVADTGLDFTHAELASQVVHVEDFTGLEGSPTICEQVYAGTDLAKTDADWAALYGGPATTDWNGHGSWIGGNIAAALDGQGINGIAPNVKLVALKISQWCGYAYDSESRHRRRQHLVRWLPRPRESRRRARLQAVRPDRCLCASQGHAHRRRRRQRARPDRCGRSRSEPRE